MARFIFLNPWAMEFFLDWEGIAHDAVAICALRRDGPPTTVACPISSVSYPRGVRISACDGLLTT